eukprot:gene10318-12070_t
MKTHPKPLGSAQPGTGPRQGPDQGFQPFAWAALVNNTPV